VCPGRTVLQRLLDGSISGHEQRAVEQHYEICDACQAALEDLAYDEQGNPSPISCPRLEVLERLLDGSISDYACEAVEHHLSVCETCQADFEALCNGDEPGPRPIACPQPTFLKRLLDGSLSSPEQEAIEHHLGTCAACQARLDALAGGDEDLTRQMQNLREGPAANSPGLKRVIGVLKDELEPEMEAASSTVSAPSEILGFLDPSDAPGDIGKLGPYRVQEMLGQGGMGIVLKAFDPTLHRAVAIKILAPQLATSSSARQRFAREARAAAAIRNEHVVAIHSVDEWKGLPYLVMEFIPGSSLQARIDHSAPLDLNSILRIGMQAATGLAAAHAQGLVHRDIKPSNILLENCVERVKITDFGLARAVDDASLTQSGVVAGTPLFMAPEQARCETIDHRADLFSLGAVLYAMCTGRSPFRASTTLGVLKRVCDDTHRPVREVNPDVPEWLSQIIDRLLAKDREDRYQTANEVVDVLGTQLARCQRGNGESLEAPPAAARQPVTAVDDVGPAKGHHRRRRWLEIVGSMIVLLAGLFVIAEATGVTRFMTPIAEVLGLRKPKSLLVIHWWNPELRVVVDHRLLPGVGIQYLFRDPSGCLVEVFKGELTTARKWIDLAPGMSAELEVTDDGELNMEYDGPIRSPLPRLPRTKTSNQNMDFDTRPLGADGRRIGAYRRWQPNQAESPEVPRPVQNTEEQQRLVKRIRSDGEAMSLLEQIKSTTEELEHTRASARNGADPALVAAQKRLEKLNQEYNDRVYALSEEIRLRMQGRQDLPDSETL
jgi:serine/threonine protein kinase